MLGALLLLLAAVHPQAAPSTATADVGSLIEALDDTADGRSFTVFGQDGRSAAIRDLVRIGGDAVPALVQALADPCRPRVVGAMLACAEIGPAAATAVSRLSRRVGDAEEEVALAAALALPRIDPKSEATTRALAFLVTRLSACVFSSGSS